MSTIQFVTVIIGVVLVLTRFPGIFWPKKFKKWMKVRLSHNLIKSISIVMIACSLVLLYVLFPFMTFVEMVDGFFTLGLLIFGLFYFFMPHFLKHTVSFWTKQKDHVISFLCLTSVLFGIILIYLAYSFY